MKKIYNILLFIILLTSFNLASANQIDFYWEKNNFWDISNSSNIEQINNKLEKFYKNTWLNTDVIILWKWDSCYLKPNFDSCIQKSKNYSSDLLIILSMKSDIKSRWDIRSLIKDEFKESITPRELKSIQDSIIYNFKNKQFTKWVLEYLDNLNNKILTKCREVWVSWKCDAVKLAKQYHNYIAKKEAEKAQSAKRKNLYYILLVIWIILWYLGLRKFYVFRLNNLYKDVKFKILTINENKIFEKDKEKLLSSYSIIEKAIKEKLWDLDKNIFTLIRYYNKSKNTFEENNKELQAMQKAFSQKEEIKEKVEKFKNIDL